MHGSLTFTRPDDVIPDEERPGLLRALPVQADQPGDTRRCDLRDLAAAHVVEPGLEEAGFETVDLSGLPSLQRTLATVREADHLSDEAALAIRESLSGVVLGLAGGKSLRIDYVVDDGLFTRRAGPNGLNVNPGGIDGANGHDSAQYVHGDQDVFGTPLRQMMHGGAPDLFRHISPDGRNDDSDTFLLNLWIPLHAPVQPLALMDRRTLDAPRHQLRYGLPVDGFLERDERASVNDIWAFLYDEDQQWYIRTDMGPDQGYVFDTLGVGHGAAALVGEPELEQLFISLHRTCEALEDGDDAAARAAIGGSTIALPPADATPTIAQAGQVMAALLDEARADVDSSAWCGRARAAMDGVIRRSIEMRLVATLVNG
ncbi:MAG: hypothetical protein HKN26_03540 [Acidimicrobiales bacterium]|nr:hypothetical protein [Acidimicrobiales bacterium]